jgi:hypothetical protein
LALQLGHRVSIDLNFFSADAFDITALRRELSDVGTLQIQAQAQDTLHAMLDGIRISYLRSEAPFLFPTIAYRGLQLADVRDIAAMKIIVVAGRGSRKDFVDLHAYLQAGGTLPALFETVRQRYAGTSFNEVHLLRSLVFFDDAEQEPMPRMLQDTSWEDIRACIEMEVRRCAP